MQQDRLSMIDKAILVCIQKSETHTICDVVLSVVAGGNPVLTHPGAKTIEKAEHLINSLTSAHCAVQCCAE